jgi:hypothetical protein
MITGIDHIHYVSNNMEEMVKYFANFFGGKEISRGEARGYPMIRMDVFGVTISFLGTDPGAGQLEPGKGLRGLDHRLQSKNMEATLEELKKKVQLSRPHRHPGRRSLPHRGPEGSGST